ncbi:hypothetical protein KAR10_03090 [bacterium]|nr:hypothetical protein [bacterium]
MWKRIEWYCLSQTGVNVQKKEAGITINVDFVSGWKLAKRMHIKTVNVLKVVRTVRCKPMRMMNVGSNADTVEMKIYSRGIVNERR